MRGGVPEEMTSTCVQGGIRPLGGFQTNVMMQPSSPASAWQFPSIVPVSYTYLISIRIKDRNNNI